MRLKKYSWTCLGLCLLFLLPFSSCRKEQFLTQAGADLRFELDTLSFDTVFTDMGSASRRFKVYNPHSQTLKISRIELAGGGSSDFSLNIDGQNALAVEEIELAGGDSLYILASARIDPNNGDAIRLDSILFETNGSQQKVYLEAYGWNAIYVGRRGYQTRFVNEQIQLSPDTPYIFLGQLYFDSSSVLTVPAGTEVFMFGGPTSRPGDRATIVIGHNSSIKVNVGGDLNQPAEFKTHRLEEDYQDLPFQHGGIYLTAQSVNNQIHGCIIRNAVDGIVIDSLAPNHPTVKLELKKSMIYNVDRSCILARFSSLWAENCILANSNQYNFINILGGDYTFRHCNLINFGTNPFVGRNEAVLSMRDFEIRYDADGNEIPVTADLRARFQNSIIYGNQAEEIELGSLEDFSGGAQWDYAFEHCLLKVDTFATGQFNCLINQEPYFRDLELYAYQIDSSASPLINAGMPLNPSLADDAESKGRDAQPDIGAYEF